MSKRTFWVKKQLLKVLIFFPNSSSLWANIHRAWQKKIFGRDVKIENCSLRLKKSIKKPNFWKFSFFFQILQNFERTFTVLGEKLFGRDIKIENCSLRLKKSIKKPNFWKFSFFSNSSELWTNIYRAGRKTFRQGYQNWKLQSSSQKINQKSKLLKVLIFFQTLQVFERTFTVLGEKNLGRDIKIENCSLRLRRTIKKPNFWKFSFFSKASELWTNIYRAWRKSFGKGYQNWNLYSLSSEYQFEDKNNFLKVL